MEFKKHWPALIGLFLSGLYIYLQLLVWRKHGDDLMLIAGSIVVTVVLWIVLIVAINHNRKRSSPVATLTEPSAEHGELLQVRSWYEQLKEQMTIAQQESTELRRERDRLQQENKKLESDKFHFTDELNKSLIKSGEFMREVEDLYADTVLCWLKTHIKTAGTAKVADVAKALELPEEIIRRGFEWLAKQYQIVRPVPGFPDAWNYTATARADLKYRIIPANRTPSQSQDERANFYAEKHRLEDELWALEHPEPPESLKNVVGIAGEMVMNLRPMTQQERYEYEKKEHRIKRIREELEIINARLAASKAAAS